MTGGLQVVVVPLVTRQEAGADADSDPDANAY